MLSKGSELFMFEGEFFKFKQRYINENPDDEMWKTIFDEGNILLKKYKSNATIEEYCFRCFSAFIEFLRDKQEGKI